MKPAVSFKPAQAMAAVAMATRIFLGLMVDSPIVHSGAWISVLLGGLLSLPWLIGLSLLRGSAPSPARLAPLRLALLITLTADSARLMQSSFRSAGYLTLEPGHFLSLLIPVGLVALWALYKGGNAIGYASMIGLRIGGMLLLLIALLQWKHYRPAWLQPALGMGWRSIFVQGVQTAGHIMSISGILLFSTESGQASPGLSSLLRPLLLGMGIATLLILPRQMMTPFMVKGHETWLKRLDSLVVNGRGPLYLQLPILILWFSGLQHLLTVESWTAYASLQALLPRLRPAIGIAIILLGSGALCLVSLPNAAGYPAFMGWCAASLPLWEALCILPRRRKEAVYPCAG